MSYDGFTVPMPARNQPVAVKKHRLNLTVSDDLYMRLEKLSPHARGLRLDVVEMLLDYCGYRERYGDNIYEGISRSVLAAMK